MSHGSVTSFTTECAAVDLAYNVVTFTCAERVVRLYRITAHRLDPVLRELDAEMAACVDQREKNRIAAAAAERETRVIGVYRQVTWWRSWGYLHIARLLSLFDTYMRPRDSSRGEERFIPGVSHPRRPGGSTQGAYLLHVCRSC